MCMMYCNDTIYLSILLWIQDTRGSRFVHSHMRARHRSHVFFQGQSCPCGTNSQECLDPVFGESFCYPCVDFWLLGQVEVQTHQMPRRNCICCIKIFRHIIYFIQYTYWKQTHFQEKVCGRSFESIARVYKFVIQYCTSGCSCFSKRLSSLAFSNYNMLASCK